MESENPVTTMAPLADAANIGIALLAVIVSIVVIAWFYRRLPRLAGARGRLLEVLASQSLGQNERVLHVRIAGKELILGVTAAQIQTLLVLDADEAAALPKPEPGFAAGLKAALRERSS